MDSKVVDDYTTMIEGFKSQHRSARLILRLVTSLGLV